MWNFGKICHFFFYIYTHLFLRHNIWNFKANLIQFDDGRPNCYRIFVKSVTLSVLTRRKLYFFPPRNKKKKNKKRSPETQSNFRNAPTASVNVFLKAVNSVWTGLNETKGPRCVRNWLPLDTLVELSTLPGQEKGVRNATPHYDETKITKKNKIIIHPFRCINLYGLFPHDPVIYSPLWKFA